MTPSEIARALGRRGGLARASRLSAAQKHAIAAKGAQARLRSLRATNDVIANFRSADAVRQLRGEPVKITRLRRFGGRLPGIYPSRS
jgi:hypothetical protein